MGRISQGGWAPLVALLLTAPVCAEFLIGYDDTIGDPVALVFGLIVFVPIYGAPAVLIREAARHTGRGWPCMLLLAAAFGVIQAGLFDQSLFNPDYRNIEYWPNLWEPTLLPGHWTSAAAVLGFVGGHVVTSIAAPIALVEALYPTRAGTPWLGALGLAGMVAMWAAGAAIVLTDTLTSESFRPSAAQLLAAALSALALVALAFAAPHRPQMPSDRRAPSPATVLVVAFGALMVRPLLDSLEVHTRIAGDWPPTLAGLVVITAFAIALGRWSSRCGWNERHRLAVAAGALLATAVVAFTVRPIGHVTDGAKYTTNAALLALLVVVLAIAAGRQRPLLHHTRLPR